MPKPYKFNTSNFNISGVRYRSVRETIDLRWRLVHDSISDCYYNQKIHPTLGLIDEAKFRQCERALTALYNQLFIEEARRQGLTDAEDKHRYQRDETGNVINDRFVEAKLRLNEAKAMGIDLEALL